MTDRYHVTYAFAQHPEGKAKEDVPSGWGACDAFLFASMLRHDDKTVDITLISGDGKTGGRLPAGEVATIAGALMKDLSEDKDLDLELRALFAAALSSLQFFVAKRKKESTH